VRVLAADRLEAFHAKPPVPTERLTHYPDYIDDPEGLERFRTSVIEARDRHDMAPVNFNSLGRLIDTIDRLAALQSPPPIVEEGRREADELEYEFEQEVDEFALSWPDGRWLVAHGTGKIHFGKSPRDSAIPIRTTNLDAILALTPVEGAGEIGDELRKNPEAIWLSPRCETDLGRTWASPAPDRECGGCGLPWVKYVRSDLAALSPPP